MRSVKMKMMSVAAHPTVPGEIELRRLRTLNRLLAALIRANSLQDVYDAALTSLLEATAADRAAILLFEDDGVIRFKAWCGLSADYRAAVTGHSPWPRGTLDAKPIAVSDVLLDESLAAYQQILDREAIRALVFLPLALDSGVFGKFMLYYSEPHECSPDELEIAQAIAGHVALATQHKRTEFAHNSSEQRLQSIIDNSASVIFLKDPEGRHLLVNRRYEELFHVTRENVVGKTDYDIFPPEIADRFRANDRVVLETAQPLTVEEFAPHDDGMHTYLSMKFPMQGADGSVSGICGIATDITWRKQLEAASQHLAAIVASSDDAIISKDLNGIITSWNRGAQHIFGYTASEVVGKPVSILAPPERVDEMPRILASILRRESVEHYETRRRRKDGQIIDVSLTVSPVYDDSGRIVGASKIARDITDRKRAERERLQLLARERDARRTAELLNRVALRLAAQLDLEKLAQELTDLATALIGAQFGAFFQNSPGGSADSLAPRALSGTPPDQFTRFAAARAAEMFQPALQDASLLRCDDITRDPRYADFLSGSIDAEPRLQLRSYLGAPVIARSGEVLGGLFFGHSEPGSLTESHETLISGIAAQAASAIDNARLFEQAQWIQSELKRSNEELRRANRDLEIFAYSASHDLQEPLRTMGISAQIIERSWGRKLPPEDAVFLTNIITAAQHMNRLVEDLLTYTRATKYEEGPPPSVDSSRVLTQVLENLRATIEQTNAVISTGALPVVMMHEVRLAQVLQNLISNAIKYRGPETPRVHVEGVLRDGWCVFSVTDNGIGIELQFAEKVFGLFKRLHGRDQYPGSGIGLAICQRVVEQYGGRIWLDRSAPGEGSTFCFSVPAGTVC